MANFAEYKQRMMPYAKIANGYTGLPVEVILVQWGLESGNGTSQKAVNNNNHGGIKWSPNGHTVGKDSGGFAVYSSLNQFAMDYSRVMKLSYYDGVRSAGRTGDINATIRALGASPYDAGHYLLNGVAGGKLLNMLGQDVSGGDQKKTVTLRCPHCSHSLELSEL